MLNDGSTYSNELVGRVGVMLIFLITNFRFFTTGLSTRKGMENAIISENQIVNVVSNSYGHLPNEKFFREVETKLTAAGLSNPQYFIHLFA